MNTLQRKGADLLL